VESAVTSYLWFLGLNAFSPRAASQAALQPGNLASALAREISRLAVLFLELLWPSLFLFFLFFKPLAELFVDGFADLDQAQLHPVQVFVKSGTENFLDRDETEVGKKLTGKTLCFHLVLKISSIDSGDLVK
jgi:hypothetical protein